MDFYLLEFLFEPSSLNRVYPVAAENQDDAIKTGKKIAQSHKKLLGEKRAKHLSTEMHVRVPDKDGEWWKVKLEKDE